MKLETAIYLGSLGYDFDTQENNMIFGNEEMSIKIRKEHRFKYIDNFHVTTIEINIGGEQFSYQILNEPSQTEDNIVGMINRSLDAYKRITK